jgi:holliday junction DNA helicase RuvA
MIGRLSGKVIIKSEGTVILDVGGVGYVIKTTNTDASELKEGEQIALWTHLSVRENSLDLFGFIENEKKQFFELLLSVSGIGPRSALSILDLAPLQELKQGIAKEDAKYLTDVSGIGKKTAQKIVLELKDKIALQTELNHSVSEVDNDVIDALRSLGYSAGEARDSLRKITNNTKDTQARLKEALKLLGQK